MATFLAHVSSFPYFLRNPADKPPNTRTGGENKAPRRIFDGFYFETRGTGSPAVGSVPLLAGAPGSERPAGLFDRTAEADRGCAQWQKEKMP